MSGAALSVVIPARNAVRTLPACLEAVRRAGDDVQIVLVDDGSTDSTGAIAQSFGATVVRHDVSGGPARARNAGVRLATADVVAFVDADIVLAKDALARVREAFAGDPDLAALFGSYDDKPAERAFVSDFRNLLHHFVHQSAREESGSFWAGCGAIRKRVFQEVGGFDERYRRPSIEDIELGGRLTRLGHRVRLDKGLRCTHLKRWTLKDVVLTDIRDRAYPWAKLILGQGTIPTDLNLRHSHRASAALAWLSLFMVAGLLFQASPDGRALLLGAIALAIAGVILLNRDFYSFLAQKRGGVFLVGAILLHGLYYVYASGTYAWCWMLHQFRRVAASKAL